MKKGWEYRSFKDVFPIKMGKTPPRGDSSSWDKTKVTSNRWVSIADISINEGKIIDDTKEYITDKAAEKINLVKAGSLLMSFKLSIGRMAFAGVDLYTNEAIIAIPKNEDYDLKFLYYYLLQYDWRTLTEGNEKVKGATLNKQSIGKIKLPVISSAEQRRIVSYLDSSFDLIDKIKENASKSLSEAKALFQSALAEAMEPKEGWEEKTLPDISENFDNLRKPVTKSKREKGSYPYYGASGIVDYVSDYLINDKVLLISEDGANLLARSTPIAFSVSGKIWVNNHAHILKFSSMTTQLFVEYYFSSINIEEYVTGAAQPKLTKKNLNKIIIPYPPLPTQKQIVSRLDSLSLNVRAIEEKYQKMIAECDALKQAMLREVFE